MTILIGMCLLHLNPICVLQTHLCEKKILNCKDYHLIFNFSSAAVKDRTSTSTIFSYSALALLLPDERPPGDFYDESGRYLGNDGIDDKRLYVLKTTDKDFDSEGKVPSAGISRKEARDARKFVQDSSGKTDAFGKRTDIYHYFQEIIPSEDARLEMIRIISKDNGKGGTDPVNNKEYGGIIKIDGSVRQVPDGPVSDPGDSARLPEILVPASPEIRVAFHSHPSGTRSDTRDERISTTTPVRIGGPSVSDHRYRQAPSSMDVEIAGDVVGYVFGMEDQKVYIYTNSGITATFPINKFKKFINTR
jgi:hypothetical protein